MSSLWTPDGERPVPGPDLTGTGARSGGDAEDPGGGPGEDLGGEIDEAEMAAQVAAMREELASSPVEVVVANHCYGLFELAAVYLSQQPPLLVQARLAIDALGYLVDGLKDRLGDTEEQLRDGLSQLRLAYVQIDGAQRIGAEVAPTSAPDATAADNGAEDSGPAPEPEG